MKIDLMGLLRYIKSGIGVLVLLLLLSFSCHGQQLESPDGRVILTISGEIGVFNGPDPDAGKAPASDQSARFDLPMLEALGLTKVATETPWTDGTIEFEGVLVRDLLELLEADGESVQAIALDDYVVEVPIADFVDYDVIVATRISGKPMRVRENGPLWIIYPWSDVAALRRPHYYARSIWQLKSIAVLP